MLEGYTSKVYGNKSDEHYKFSETVQKVVIENGKVVSATGERLGTVIADLGNSNIEDNDKTITKIDSKTNIKLETTSDILADDIKMEITEITTGDIFDKIKNTLSEIKNFKAFDITLKANDTNIQPNGKVKISIPIPVGFDVSKLIVYRLDENNTKTEYQVTTANEYATFETDHFSTYILGEKSELSNETQDNVDENIGGTFTGTNNTKLPQTGEETNAFAEWLTIAISLMIFWFVSMLLIDHEKKKMTKK